MRAPRLSRVLATAAVATAMAVVPVAGVAVAAPAAPAAPVVAPPCPVGTLCTWDQENFTGRRKDVFQCGVLVVVPDVQSYVNNQTEGTRASFFGPGAHSRQDFQFNSTAFEARATKVGITPNGVGPTTAVKPC